MRRFSGHFSLFFFDARDEKKLITNQRSQNSIDYVCGEKILLFSVPVLVHFYVKRRRSVQRMLIVKNILFSVPVSVHFYVK